MKNVTISYDDEKLSALRLYLGQKDGKVEDELLDALEALYQKTVPANVRGYLDMKSGVQIMEPVKKKKKISSSSVGQPDPDPGGDGS